MPKPFVQSLQDLLGESKVLSSDPELLCYSYDATALLSSKPDAVVRAKSADVKNG